MFRPLGLMVATVSLLTLPAGAWAQASGRDYAPFSKIDGFNIDTYKDSRFDASNFAMDDTGKMVRVEGRRIQIQYRAQNNQNISELEVKRTLEEQAASINADILLDKPEGPCQGNAYMFVARFQRNGSPVWVGFSCSGNSDSVSVIYVNIVEERPFHPAVKPN
jgi:hypothetical protein